MEDLIKLAKENPNDRDLGKVTRSIISENDILKFISKENPNDEDLGKKLRIFLNKLD